MCVPHLFSTIRTVLGILCPSEHCGGVRTRVSQFRFGLLFFVYTFLLWLHVSIARC